LVCAALQWSQIRIQNPTREEITHAEEHAGSQARRKGTSEPFFTRKPQASREWLFQRQSRVMHLNYCHNGEKIVASDVIVVY
jgi:hypothetical protein